MKSGATATSANAPSIVKAATRSPVSRRVPPTSLPGTNGKSGLIWYSPRVCSTSGNETPAECTSTTTPLPGVTMCDGSGSGMSTSSRAPSGPFRFVIWIARMARDAMGRRAAPSVAYRDRRLLLVRNPARADPHRRLADQRLNQLERLAVPSGGGGCPARGAMGDLDVARRGVGRQHPQEATQLEPARGRPGQPPLHAEIGAPAFQRRVLAGADHQRRVRVQILASLILDLVVVGAK